MPGFMDIFSNPYLGNLPPEVQAQLQQRSMFDLGASMLANNTGRQDGMAAFGQALRQWRAGQMNQGSQALNMHRLAEQIRLAQEQGQRAQVGFQGGGYANELKERQFQEQQRQFEQRDKTTRRGQDIGAQTARDVAASRNSLFGLGVPGGPGGPGGPDMTVPTKPADQARVAFERAEAEAQRAGQSPAATRQTQQQTRQTAQEQLIASPQSAEQVMKLFDAGEFDRAANTYHAKRFAQEAIQMNILGAGDKKRLQEWLRERGG